MANGTKNTKEKPVYDDVQVQLNNGRTVTIGRCSLENYSRVSELQDMLLGKFFDCDAQIGILLSDNDTRALLDELCSYLPIKGNKGTNNDTLFLSLEDIDEDWEQLIVLFFHGNLLPDRTFGTPLPSKISALHFLAYQTMMTNHVKRIKKQLTEKEEEDLQI